PANVQFEDRKLAGTVDPNSAGLLVLDADGDGTPDLLAWSQKGIILYRSGREVVANSGLGNLTGVVFVAAGDFDNDGLPDLCVISGAGARLFRNVKGRFTEADSKLPSGAFHSAVWLDFDH